MGTTDTVGYHSPEHPPDSSPGCRLPSLSIQGPTLSVSGLQTALEGPLPSLSVTGTDSVGKHPQTAPSDNLRDGLYRHCRSQVPTVSVNIHRPPSRQLPGLPFTVTVGPGTDTVGKWPPDSSGGPLPSLSVTGTDSVGEGSFQSNRLEF